jgi:hypothetical protein
MAQAGNGYRQRPERIEGGYGRIKALNTEETGQCNRSRERVHESKIEL